MKVLLDECVDQDLRHHVVGHDVFSVGYLRWKGTKNGRLLARAFAAGFDAMVTTDREIEFQQNLLTLPVTVYVLMAVSGQLEDLVALIPQLLTEMRSHPSRPQLIHIDP